MNKNIKTVQETDIGVYVATSNGLPIDDGDGHVLLIQSRELDLKRISTLMKAARDHGYNENLGYDFIPGVRPVSDQEALIQQARLEAGLQPDTQELGTAIDDIKRGRAIR